MEIIRYPDKKNWPQLLKRPVQDFSSISAQVRPILNDVQANGDKALAKYALQFDKVELSDFQVSQEEIAEAGQQVSPELESAIQLASKNITAFHKAQLNESVKIETAPGVFCWQKLLPIEKVGLYIPGGSAPLFSTVLMLAIPATLAGCNEIVFCSPPNKHGKIHPAILYTAQLCGVSKIFKIGGAQAIAALAYGTECVPQVYKIFGPGNQYVTATKQLVAAEGVAIDMPAGPSEVAVIADATANPQFVAADLLSQAEHGADSQVVLITTEESLIESVLTEIETQLKTLPRKTIAEAALANSKVILCKSLQTAMEISNAYAPEHLILQLENAEAAAEMVTNAGSVFIGKLTPESAGDYASGTNHTLPTNGFARSYSGVSTESFMKKVTFQQISEKGLKHIGPAIEIMAEAEELNAHKQAVSLRLKEF